MSDVARVRERGAAFVRSQGDELASLRADALAGIGDAADAMAGLARELGDAPLDVASSLRVLGIADDLRSLRAPLAERACVAATEAQAEDGSVGAPGAPPEDRLVATGMLAGHLAKSPFARNDFLDAAADSLARAFSPDLFADFAWSLVAAYASCFANVTHDESDPILQWCGRELERGFRAGRYDAVRTARVLVWCDAHAVPGARADAGELVGRIVTDQESDGGWLLPAEPGADERIAHTLDALAALSRLS